MESILEQKLHHQSSTPKKMDIHYLKTITKNFSQDQIIGHGGYGIVYKGEQENGEVVAVKKLIMSMAGMDDKKFMNEVQHVMDICHPNIVKLKGYCYHTEKELILHNGDHIFVAEVYRLLCFEYLPNGTLDKYLRDESSGLDWHVRYNIIEGICTGLYCLHEGREGAPILHLDLKPSNILLDKNMTPKIADFGLSRLFEGGKTHTCTTNIIGSRGYMAPEYIDSFTLSKESDIFSLGVIIVEIMTGHRKYPEGTSNEEFIEVYEKWKTRLQKTSKKTSLEEECRQVDQCIRVGLKCMDKDQKRRPNIREIVEILERIKCSVREDGIYTSPGSSSLVPDSGTNSAREDSGQVENTEDDISGDPIFVLLKDGSVNTVPEKAVKNTPRGWGMEVEESLLERILDGKENPRDLPLALLDMITNSFSPERKIGQGGFGAVYKGVLGERIVAVKRIYENIEIIADKLYVHEFYNLLKINNNENVVRFLGFCSKTSKKVIERDGSMILADVRERLFCFEYISNGSLDKHITDELRGLEWETRYEIITGICKGLRYLHEEKDIIHMDLKPANILLSYHMVPKITDFGLSIPNKNSHTMDMCFGTVGYIAPEYRDHGKTTPACDIYSLGLIIIELITGYMEVPDKNNVLRRWRHRWNKPPTLLQYHQVTRCIDIAVRCRNQEPKARPSISEIIYYLSEPESMDDMLGIRPLELRLPAEQKNTISWQVELTNGTDNCIAFNILVPNPQLYSAKPEKGIVQPRSKNVVTVTVQARDVGWHDHADKFIVQSMQVEGLRDEDITEGMFCAKGGKVVDSVDLMIVYEPAKRLKYREDTNMPAEEVPEAKKRKNAESSS